MKLVFVVVCSLLALALAAPSASAIPPVCLEKGASALGTSVEIWITCGPHVEVNHCPPVGAGPCWAMTTELLA